MIDAMKQALEALELEMKGYAAKHERLMPAAHALRLAIEQAEKQEQEPAAYLNASYEGDDLYTGKQLRAAVAAEREACAKVCEERSPVKGGEVFAARIRARSTKE